jgi:hypothetical protein
LIRIPTYCTYYEYCLSTILPTAANLAKPLSACFILIVTIIIIIRL